MTQANPILKKLHAGPAVKKLVETAIILNNSQDPQQRTHAFSFMESAIKELDGTVGSAPNEMGNFENEDGLDNHKIGEQTDDDVEHKLVHEQEDDDDEHKVKEEVLDNHNNGPREDGSEQSTENEEPYPGTALDSTTGEKPMQDMDGTVNQWNETGGMPPGAGGMPNAGSAMNGQGMIVPGLPPQQGPGLAPDIAQEMGMGMPQLPPMDTNQMMRQMQYTVDTIVTNLRKREIEPLRKRLQEQSAKHSNDIKHYNSALRQQKEAIKTISQELQETKAYNGSMKLDIDSLRKNANASFRETVPAAIKDLTSFDSRGIPGIQPMPSQNQIRLSAARSEIEQMDKILNSKTSMYN